ncbi:MAG: sugar phosphate isomerase/epimerase [Bacteroidales bacterium]|nr:sugar phosphate isomerase/epimerase [Bacteroidales bacterium]
MKKILFFTTIALIAICSMSCRRDKEPSPMKISIFCDHIGTVSRQEGISFAEAATKIKEIGYSGADIRVFQNPDHIRILDSLGFAHACAIADIPYCEGPQEELEAATLSFMEEKKFDRLLLVPGLMKEGMTESEKKEAIGRIAAFAAKVTSKGYVITVEDYDNNRSLCYNGERLDALLKAAPDLSLAFDTGNFLFAGDDTGKQLEHFMSRIKHVHLKDRVSSTDMTCVPAGTGCAGIQGIVQKLLDQGYNGWFTIEQYGSRAMLEDSRTAFQTVGGFLSGE